MFLACDIGNSRIKYALFKEDELIEYNSLKNADSFFKIIRKKEFASAGISSVVPSRNQAVSGKIKKMSGIKPHILDKTFPFSFKINYETLDTLGIDRICSAEGAFQIIRRKSPEFTRKKNNYILTVDFGTATTVNVLKMPGEFTGGMILPGIEMMFNSLKKNTEQLPAASIKDYKDLIGTGTNPSIASGVINSNAGLIQIVCEYLRKKKAGEIRKK